MALIRSFRDLKVYQMARKEAYRIFALTKTFPIEEKFSLIDQIRRASRAVGSMVAEAWSKRRYEAAFIAKLTDALGEAAETQAWLDSALDCAYIDGSEHGSFDAPRQSIGAMLAKMIERSNTFCFIAK
jgi:four helix bundle protein